MKFCLKYPKARVGSLIREQDLMVFSIEKPCCICGESTGFVSYTLKKRVCSDECLDKATEVEEK